MTNYLGIDVGTTGLRAIAIDRDARVVASAGQSIPEPQVGPDGIRQDPWVWWSALSEVLARLGGGVLGETRAIAIDGTSGTVLLCDDAGAPMAPARMYNDKGDQDAVRDLVQRLGAAAAGGAQTLRRTHSLILETGGRPCRVQHQADWLAGRLIGDFGYSDYNNALKLGYDNTAGNWPTNYDKLTPVEREGLPSVVPTGTKIGVVSSSVKKDFGIKEGCIVRAGTTDGVAAHTAALGGKSPTPGDAVTSLGTTLVLKVLSGTKVTAPELGVYSHRYGTNWLAGGASNSGGAALLDHFSLSQIEKLSAEIDPTVASPCDFYPLRGIGERFPIYDDNLLSCTQPRPPQDRYFLHGLLEGVARIERRGYMALAELGAGYPTRVVTVGGGATNKVWGDIRQRVLGATVILKPDVDTAYGSALIALNGPFN